MPRRGARRAGEGTRGPSLGLGGRRRLVARAVERGTGTGRGGGVFVEAVSIGRVVAFLGEVLARLQPSRTSKVVDHICCTLSNYWSRIVEDRV